MEKRESYKLAILFIAASVLIHTAFAFPSDNFFLLIAIGFVIVGKLLLSATRLLSGYNKEYSFTRYLAIWYLSGSCSNLIDEIAHINTKRVNYETLVFIIIVLILLKREKNLIADAR